MTRRDYCKECKEIVGDWDIMCNQCHESFCYNCFTTYDSLSRLCNLYARFNVMREPTITLEEFDQLCQDLQSDNFVKILKGEINDLYEYNDSLSNLNELLNMLEFYTKSRDNISKSNINKIKDILEDYMIEDFEICKCKECYGISSFE